MDRKKVNLKISEVTRKFTKSVFLKKTPMNKNKNILLTFPKGDTCSSSETKILDYHAECTEHIQS